ncbi:hypothetical protein B0H67DRAFT_681913 [Lasiosphaeris hirsuta]|uniref:Uncharacterized protein n=1 Tax=Lasiosphaeris hirsuta TaxID=260670 RepID=A0AA40AQ11_9PEZI|nr:hypothetical protein B0H67DRAFT_681913 [Lasiosphaeris hirsuta]
MSRRDSCATYLKSMNCGYVGSQGPLLAGIMMVLGRYSGNEERWTGGNRPRKTPLLGQPSLDPKLTQVSPSQKVRGLRPVWASASLPKNHNWGGAPTASFLVPFPCCFAAMRNRQRAPSAVALTDRRPAAPPLATPGSPSRSSRPSASAANCFVCPQLGRAACVTVTSALAR